MPITTLCIYKGGGRARGEGVHEIFFCPQQTAFSAPQTCDSEIVAGFYSIISIQYLNPQIQIHLINQFSFVSI